MAKADVPSVQYISVDPRTTMGKPDFIPDPKTIYEEVDEEANIIMRYKKIFHRDGSARMKLVEMVNPADIKIHRPALPLQERMRLAAQKAAEQGADISDINEEINVEESETGYGSETCKECGMIFPSEKDLTDHECEGPPDESKAPKLNTG